MISLGILVLATAHTGDLVLGLITAVLTGVGVKIVDSILNRGEQVVDEATQLRKELRKEVTFLTEELNHVRMELDACRESYYELLSDYERLKLEYEMLKLSLNAE